jgi:peptidoglycan/LPS O-acetylase OafA/YrhL
MRERQTNNFDVIRLAAALLVLWSHSYPLTGTREPISAYFGFLSGGAIAVDVFFFISGYLVSQSAENRPLIDYARARALRILPALAVAVLFCILLGAAFTTLPQAAYWSSPGTWDYLRNAYVFGIRFTLPGVFESLPHPAVNGSIWTLPIEATMYIVAALIALIGIRRPVTFIILAIATAAALFVAQYIGVNWTNRGPAILPSVPLFNLLWLGYFFMAGAAFAKFKPTARPVFGVVAAMVTLTAPLVQPLGQAIYFAAFPVLIYVVSFANWRVGTPRGIDMSYGVYLYAMPIQQTIIQGFGPDLGPTLVSLAATPAALLLGLASAVLIERPALRLKSINWGSTALLAIFDGSNWRSAARRSEEKSSET